MRTEFRGSFVKDLKAVTDRHLLKRLRERIAEVDQANSPAEIQNLKKLKGRGDYYRMRVGDYRIGIAIEGDTVIFVRFLNRKEVYKYFP